MKAQRPLSAEAQAANAAWIEEQIVEPNLRDELIEEVPTVALAELDAETRFRARAALGSRERGLRLLDELNRSE